MPMLSIGIDVSKGKSTVCGMKPGGEIVYTPFEVQHCVHRSAKSARPAKLSSGSA